MYQTTISLEIERVDRAMMLGGTQDLRSEGGPDANSR